MLLGACGGSGNGSTWFNLPSVPVKIQADGSAKVFGFNLGPVLTADQVTQLQTANIQQLNIRVGHNGIHPYANGEDLPYVAWNDDSFATVQEILPKVPGLANAGTISTGLTWARRIGLGAALNLPVAAGQTALEIPRWKGETTFTKETPSEVTVGPFDLAGLAIDDSGSLSIDGMPLSQLESALGMSFGVSVPADLITTLKAIGAETISVATNPNGIDLGMNGKPLPSLAYDSASLNRSLALVEPFVSDPALVAQLKDLLPKLPGADVRIVAAVGGPAAGKTALGKLPFTMDEQGRLGLYGFTLTGSLLPPAMVQQLQAANLQQLDAKVEGVGSILLAANGVTLPTVGLNDATLPAVSQLVGSLAGLQPTLVSTIVNLLKDTGVSASLNLPLAAGAEPVTVGDPFADGIQAPNLGDFAPPILHLNVAYDRDNKLKSIGPVTGQDLDQAGMALPLDLPPSITSVLTQVGANEVQAINTPGQFDLMINKESAVALKYDVDSLIEVLRLLAPFMKGTIMEDPGINGLIQQQILPLVPGSDVNLNVMLNQ